MYEKKKFVIICLVGLLLSIGIGYAYLTGNLSINGDALIKSSSWDIYWNNVQVTNGSVMVGTGDKAAVITPGDKTEVTYEVSLTNPRDFYEFTVDAKNDGTMDAMISTVANNVYVSSDLNNPITLPSYLACSITYSDGMPVAQNQILRAGQSETYKVRLYYRDDIDPSLLPQTVQNLSFRFTVTYVQADNNAKNPHPVSFADDDWDTIISAAQAGNTSAYTVGATKTVDMGALGTHTLRVANNSTPAECSTVGFSQTACGFVLEFADIITTHEMNSTMTNVGGWPASSMRTYVNTDIYNALPSGLKSSIIDTTVVSGHGSTSGETNFTSTDKLYLLSTKEVGFEVSYDTAKAETRILDYYNANNSNAARVKQYNSSSYWWWLRAADSNYAYFFNIVLSVGSDHSDYANTASGVSPAFRIG